MKIMLIFPPLTVSERYASKNVGDVGGYLPPLGLLYMAAVLENSGHEVKVLDCPVNNYTIDNVLRFIDEFQPDWVGMAAVTVLINRVIELNKLIHEKFPKVKILIGGPHATIRPKETSEQTGADIVITNEVEDVLVDILENYDKKYKRIKIVEGKPVLNIDRLPFPARHLIDMKLYTSLPNNYKRDPYAVHMVTTRGCPYTCTFCASANGIFRQRSVENVVAEIKHLQKTYDTKEIVFWDDIFTLNKYWISKFCDTLISEGIDIAWSCESRLDLITEEMVNKMAKAGCWNMFFGIESGNQDILNNIKKRTNLDLIRRGVKYVKASGIEVRGSFMLGLPGETPEKARNTIKFAIELDPDYAQFSITTPYPGTELYKTIDQWGILNENFDNFHNWSPVFIPKGYKNSEELQAMQREAFRRFYLRPKYIARRLSKIRSLDDVKRNLKGARMIFGFAT